MIAKRYGRKIESVTAEFNAVAMNEIGFRRDHEWTMAAEDFDGTYDRADEHSLAGSGEGDVQSEVEAGVLARLLADVQAIEAAAAPGDVLVVENQTGVDYPRLHSTQRSVVVGFENRLHFTYEIDPPLRIGVYRPRQS